MLSVQSRIFWPNCQPRQLANPDVTSVMSRWTARQRDAALADRSRIETNFGIVMRSTLEKFHLWLGASDGTREKLWARH